MYSKNWWLSACFPTIEVGMINRIFFASLWRAGGLFSTKIDVNIFSRVQYVQKPHVLPKS